MIEEQKDSLPVSMMCRHLGISRSAYYASRTRPQSVRSKANDDLITEIESIHDDSLGTYGSPRVHAELAHRGHSVGVNRVARLMQISGIRGVIRGRFCPKTTDSDHGMKTAPNILDREFNVTTPNTVWAGDITYIPTRTGWLYLAVVIDLYSRRVVGWSMTNHMRSELVESALSMAIGNRSICSGLMHHSDRGSQYASHSFQKLLRENKIRCSMSRRAECYDNAVVESFFGTLKAELVHQTTFLDQDDARQALHKYIEVFYNRNRRHSSIGYMTPVEFENSATAA